MDERYTWLRDRVAEERRVVSVGAVLLHERTADADAKLAFLLGSGAGQISNMIDAFAELVDIHRAETTQRLPEPAETWCSTCSMPDEQWAPWPCATITIVARAFRHAPRYSELWEAR